MRVIAFANQKGGCGKTTVATNLAAALTQIEKRVLLLDNDPQGHATLAYGFLERDFSLSTYDFYMTSDILVEDAFLEITPSFHLVPAGIELSAVEQVLAREQDKERRLIQSLRRSALPYDYILIDCPPSVGLLTFNALLACSEVIIPVDPSNYGLHAVRKLKETLGVLRETLGHDLISHLLLANFDTRSRFTHALAEELEALYGSELLQTIIHHTVRVKEAASAGVPVIRYDTQSRGALDFRNLAREMVEQEVDLTVSALDHWVALLYGPEVQKEHVTFLADFPRAKTVQVTGSFNDWSLEGLPLQRRQDGVWECRVKLNAGEHEYRYIVDGDWRSDPHNREFVSNRYGDTNSLVRVP